MDFINLFKQAAHALGKISPAIQAIEQIAKAANSIEEFRESVAKSAKAGDLDEAYEQMFQLREDVLEFVTNG